MCLSDCLPTYLSMCLFFFVCLLACLFLCRFVCLFFSYFIILLLHLLLCLSNLFSYLSICPSAYVPINLLVYPLACLVSSNTSLPLPPSPSPIPYHHPLISNPPSLPPLLPSFHPPSHPHTNPIHHKLHRFVLGSYPKDERARLCEVLTRTLTRQIATKGILKMRTSAGIDVHDYW